MQILNVEEKYDNKKLSTYLLGIFPMLKRGTLFKALRKKDIRVNNVRISEDVTIHTGDEIKVFITDELLCINNFTLDIIFEDDNILVINKPVGIEVIDNAINEVSLTTLCKEYINGFIEPCHRIDRNTTGLVLFAKNEQALNILLDKFKNKEIEKHYIARVYGFIRKEHEILTDYLFKDSKKSMVYISHSPKKDYLQIITEYTVISRNIEENTTTLDINLHTGRTHQIRAHLAYIGYPIIGDGKYGNNEINKKFGLKTQDLTSYKIKFKFKTNSGILNYLNDKEIIIN